MKIFFESGNKYCVLNIILDEVIDKTSEVHLETEQYPLNYIANPAGLQMFLGGHEYQSHHFCSL
jgi:hypothetical protein